MEKRLHSLKNRLIDDAPFIFIVMVIMSLCAALVPSVNTFFVISAPLFAIALVKSFFWANLFALLCGGRKWAKRLVFTLILGMLVVYVFLLLKFNVRINPNVTLMVLQTSPQETTEFLSSYFPLPVLLALLATITVFATIYWLLNRLWNECGPAVGKVAGRRLALFLSVSIVLLFISAGLNVFHKSVVGRAALPHQDIYSSLKAVCGNARKVEHLEKANEAVVLSGCSDSAPHIVFVIGESHSKSHSSLYGYSHDTNPLLEQQQRSGNLFLFTDVVSPCSTTNGCMHYFYSTKSVDDAKVWEDSPLLQAVFKKAGYYVSLLDNQAIRSTHDVRFDFDPSYFLDPEPIAVQCLDYRNRSLYRYDQGLVDEERALRTERGPGRSLSIVHLKGSHVDAEKRYPHDDFSYFSSDSIHRVDLKGSSLERSRIAHYDNSIRYNDYIMNELFEIYCDDDVVLVYLSDHGECVYDNSKNTYGRSISEIKDDETIKVLFEVPMYIWCSDSYMDKHPDMLERIKKAVDRPFIHDDICHVLFDLAGIDADCFEPERSVINNGYKPRRRIIDEGVYDYDAHTPSLDSLILKSNGN